MIIDVIMYLHSLLAPWKSNENMAVMFLDGEMDVSMEVPIDDRDWMERRSVFILPQKH